jgi:hypothetical protein
MLGSIGLPEVYVSFELGRCFDACSHNTDAGYRRAMLNTQGIPENLFSTTLLILEVDDMFLTTKLWTSPDPAGNYRVVPSDLEGHIPWMASINSRLPAGSNYTIEIGHNGNGNIGVCNCCILPCLNTTYIHPRAEIDTSPNEATVSSLQNQHQTRILI